MITTHVRISCTRGFIGSCRKDASEKRAVPAKRLEKHKYNREYKTGFTQEQFDAQLMSQGFRCMICLKEKHGKFFKQYKLLYHLLTITLGARDLHADHDHGDWQRRGILCHRCNTSLQEGDGVLERSARYLQFMKSQKVVMSGGSR